MSSGTYLYMTIADMMDSKGRSVAILVRMMSMLRDVIERSTHGQSRRRCSEAFRRQIAPSILPPLMLIGSTYR